MTPWELSHCPIVISQVTRGLAQMLSGGACWSLWERLGVWTALTARASGALIIQLNPDRLTGPDVHVQARMQSTYTRANKNTSEQKTHTAAQGVALACGGPSSLPVLSQLPVTWVTQL